MGEIESIKQTIIQVAQAWPQVGGLGDPNTVDVYWLGREIHSRLHVRLPTELPDKEKGVQTVECVESEFVSRLSLIRGTPCHILAETSQRLIEAIQSQGLLPHAPVESLVVAFYTWHGCINMAKCLRKTYVVPGGEVPYSIQQRWQGYNEVQTCWQAEDSRGNPWVRYGVSLARLLGRKRGNIVVEDWVPRDSPYWQ